MPFRMSATRAMARPLKSDSADAQEQFLREARLTANLSQPNILPIHNMGLDPNKWFRNVEMAILKSVGQETVVYVSNINKYYVIYKNAIKDRDKREKEKAKIEG